MKKIHAIVLASTVLLAPVSGLVAGEKVDNTVDQTAEGTKKAADKTEKGGKKALDKTKEGSKKAGKKIKGWFKGKKEGAEE